MTGLLTRAGWLLASALIFMFCAQVAESTDTAAADLYQRQFNRNEREVGSCKVNCTNAKVRPVCASDGHTYQHKCAIRRIRKCEKKNIRVVAKGQCRDLGGEGVVPTSKCLEERRQALESQSRPRAGNYIPQCEADGSYSDVQCHRATGYWWCWCVSADGKPIPRSSVRGRNISCRGTKGKSRGKKNKKERTGCSPAERSQFNTQLIRLFSEEFLRIPKPTPPKYPGAPRGLPIQSESDSLLDTPEKRVIEWKFSELDTKKDNKLRRREVRPLKRMIKKLVKPKACAKTFDQYCDLDQDHTITRSEWSVCLGVDINNEQWTTPSPDEPHGGGIALHNYDVTQLLRSSAEGLGGTDPPGGATLYGRQTSPLNSGRSKPRLTPSIGSQPKDKNQGNSGSSSEKRSCIEERRLAEEMDRNDPEGRIFIPECVGEGRYRAEQCHNSTGYCWCVDSQTGKPIPGTSTHNVVPNCSNIRSSEFKGCPYHKKKKFLVDLLDQLTTEMMEYAQNASVKKSIPEPNPDQSLEEQAVRWKLKLLDLNNNQQLERREWKVFKKEIRRKKGMRKCGRNFLRYCDVNDDRKITIEEWIDCMGVNAPDQQRNLPRNPKRRGPNPFSKYLKASPP